MATISEELTSRWQRIREEMKKQDLQHLLVYSSQLKPEFIHYAANYSLLGEKAICYIPSNGQPVLWISEAWDLERAGRESPVQDIRVLSRDWPRDLAGVVDSSDLALAGLEFMPGVELDQLNQVFKKEVPSATRLLEKVATIKSPYELDLIREASKIADAGFYHALEVMREGLTDFQLGAEIEYKMRQMGATDNFQMLAVGRNNTGMLLPMGKRVKPNDLILFEITPIINSVTYYAQLCRTAIFGAGPDDLLNEKYELGVRALESSLSVIKPGEKIGAIARVQNEIIGSAGYEQYCRPPYMRTRGHGFGLGLSISIDENETMEFEEGMCMVVHPNQYYPEVGYLALGETIVVTADGAERLTGTDSRIYQCGGDQK